MESMVVQVPWRIQRRRGGSFVTGRRLFYRDVPISSGV